MFPQIIKLILFLLFSTSIYSNEIILNNIRYTPQTWNNCAPASLSMVFSYYNIDISQTTIESYLKTFKDDVHISPNELKDYVASKGYYLNIKEVLSINDIIPYLNNNIPIIVPIWYIRNSSDQMGHYIVVHGYDLNEEVLYIKDPLEYGRETVSINEFDSLWKVFNRTVITFYPDSVKVTDDEYSSEELLEHRIKESQSEPDSFSTWYNLGIQFSNLGKHNLSLNSFKKSLDYPYPNRFFWYNSRIFETLYLTGEYNKIIELSNEILRSCLCLEEIWYWRARAQYALNDKETALLSINRALQYRSTFKNAIDFKETSF